MAKTLTVYLAADLKKFNQGMDDASRKAQGLGGTMSSVLGPALIGAGAAAGAFAVKLGVDGVKAAIDDEAASAKLAQTLTNLGLAHDTQPVEDYISTLERSLGVADDELRPAYDRLVRSIGDTEKANEALSLALDVSAGSGKSLDAVVQALGKAYDGNVTGLSRLGAGLDKAILATGDMDAITAQLAATFGGQATTQAGTFQGQVQRLQIAVDNLAEAFGYGLLNSLEDTNKGTGDLTGAMEDFEPVVRLLGQRLGETAAGLGDVVGPLADTADGMQEASEQTNGFSQVIDYMVNDFPLLWNGLRTATTIIGDFAGSADDGATSTAALSGSLFRSAVAAERAVPGFVAVTEAVDDSGAEASDTAVRYLSLAQAINAAAGTTFNWRQEINGSTADAQDLGIELNYNAFIARQNAAAAEAAAGSTRRYGGSASSAAGDADKLTKAQERLTKVYDQQENSLDGLRKQLSVAMDDLDAATDAWSNYFDAINSGLAKSLDLGAAYEGQFTETGEATGQSLLDGFNKQVAQAEWFGNVLNELKRQGADSAFIQEVAGLGPGIGGALGQQLIDDGLVPTLSEKWVNAQTAINGLAAQIVPTFLQTGVDSATATVTGLATQVAAEAKALTKTGKELAKPVGAGFKAQIAADVLEAVRAVEAAQTAARAERVANETARQTAITEQAVAQALGNLVARADARTGRAQASLPPYLVLG